MRIRVATLIWRDGYGGAERSIRDLAAALDRDRFEMRFFYLAGGTGPFSREITDLGYVVEYLDWRNGFSLDGRLRLLQRLRRFEPMIVHDHIIPPLTRPLLKLVCRCTVLHTEHGEAMRHAAGKEGMRRLFARFDLLFCDRVLANSYASKSAVQQAYQFQESKINVVYLGIDLQRFSQCNDNVTNDNCHRIGFVGRILNEHKGVDYLPRVARALMEMGLRNVEFVLIGEGPDRLAVEDLCEQLNVSHQFTFLGGRSDVQALMEKLDVLLVPSRFESFSLSVLEALALGVRVVGFDVGGVREAVGSCECARLVPPGDIHAMAQAIISMINSAQNCLEDSRAYVATRFSNQRMAGDIQQIYNELLSS